MSSKESNWTQMGLNNLKGAWMSLISSNEPVWAQMSLNKPNWV